MFVKICIKYKLNKIWNNIQKRTLSNILSLGSSKFVGGDFKFNLARHSNIANVLNGL